MLHIIYSFVLILFYIQLNRVITNRRDRFPLFTEIFRVSHPHGEIHNISMVCALTGHASEKELWQFNNQRNGCVHFTKNSNLHSKLMSTAINVLLHSHIWLFTTRCTLCQNKWMYEHLIDLLLHSNSFKNVCGFIFDGAHNRYRYMMVN